MGAPKGNKFALGLTTSGKPPIFKSPEGLQKKCEEYFISCIENGEKATVTGLTLFAGFCSRSSWDDYVKKNEYSYIVKRAKLTVENSYENSATTFDMFALKNMGWVDRSEIVNKNTEIPSSEEELKSELERIRTAKKGS